MITFTVCLLLLVIGYFAYGGYIAHIFGPTSRQTPAFNTPDGADYVPMPAWKIFLFQFLNIAGLGPILGTIMGAKFGVSSFIWIVAGSIFIGSVHDYMSGMISLRHNGASLPEVIGQYLGRPTKWIIRLFILAMLLILGAKLVTWPAAMLASLTPNALSFNSWMIIIFVFYLLVTLLPINYIVDHIYPVLTILFLFMVIGVLVMIYVIHPALPELWDGLENTHPDAGTTPIFPIMFISISCGAVCGLHSIQNPLSARCITSEHYGQPVFFGSMIVEGIVTLIWAAAATWFFHEKGMLHLTDTITIVDAITSQWLGMASNALAVLGTIIIPLASGCSIFRSSRFMLSESIGLPQSRFSNRLYIGIPSFLLTAGVILYGMEEPEQFNQIWQYFGWTNHLLATLTLWAITIYLFIHKKTYFVSMIPAIFMTTVCGTYICLTPEGFGCSLMTSYSIGFVCAILVILIFIRWAHTRGHSREV